MHLVLCLVCVCWLYVHLGWGDRLSTPQVQRLLLHEPWLLRRKRDCTPALFLTSSVCSPAMSLRSSEEEGLAPLPSSSQCRGVLRRRRDRPTSSQFRRVLRRWRDRPSSSQCRYVRRLLAGCAVQDDREQDRAGLLTVGVWVGIRFAHGYRSVPLGTLCDTMRWVCSCGKIGLGCQLTGRFGDTMVCGLANDLHVVLVGTARDALRYQAVMCVIVRGHFRTE